MGMKLTEEQLKEKFADMSQIDYAIMDKNGKWLDYQTGENIEHFLNVTSKRSEEKALLYMGNINNRDVVSKNYDGYSDFYNDSKVLNYFYDCQNGNLYYEDYHDEFVSKENDKFVLITDEKMKEECMDYLLEQLDKQKELEGLEEDKEEIELPF